jgi:hypothetical protein
VKGQNNVWEQNFFLTCSWRFLRSNKSILLFESLHVLWVLLYPASRPNHTSYRNFYFHEFAANVLRDNMCIIIFDLQGCGGQTHHILAHTQRLVHLTAPVLLTKVSIRNYISYDFQPPYLEILEPSPQGLISS